MVPGDIPGQPTKLVSLGTHLEGLTTVPNELRDAARVDGAGEFLGTGEGGRTLSRHVETTAGPRGRSGARHPAQP